MTDSMAQPQGGIASRPLELAGWKTAACWCAAVLMSLLFLLSGLWKLTDVQGAAVRMVEARVPHLLGVPAALAVGIAETYAGALLMVPRYRRWGAALATLLLLAFMAYIGINYNALRGADCSCFPWVERLVGPAFFVGDTVMLLLVLVAAMWAHPAGARRGAILVLGAVMVFAGVSYGVGAVRQTGVHAPATVTVDGKPYAIQHGKVFLFFFNPECMHCYDAATRMSHMNWGETKVVAIPVEMPQFGGQFLSGTGLKAALSSDFDKLRTVFAYKSYPFGVALENGVQTEAMTNFEAPEPEATLRRLKLAQ